MLVGWRKLGWLSLALICFSVGCGNDNSKVRIMQGSPDESSIDALIDGKTVASSIAYATASNYVSVSSGSRHLQIEPSGSTTFIVDESISLQGGANSTVVLSNVAPNITTLNLADDNSAPSSGNFKVRLVNVSPTMGPADVFVVAPGTDLGSVSPNVSSLQTQSASGYLTITAGTYEIFFTVPGSVSSFIDTGPITFATGQVRTVVALNGLGGGFTFSTLADLN